MSGDDKNTCEKAAEDANLFTTEDPVANHEIMEASHFRRYCGKYVQSEENEWDVHYESQEIFNKLTDNLKVLARASPEDKLLLSNGLRLKGKTVATLGYQPYDLQT